MFLETDFVEIAKEATRDHVIDLIQSLGEGANSIAILGDEDQIYMQTIFLSERNEFALEFRNGEPRQHYTVNIGSKDTVLSAFLSYFERTNRWRTMVEWRRDSHYEEIQDRPDGFVDTEEYLAKGGGPRIAIFGAAPDTGNLQRQLADRNHGADIEIIDIEQDSRIVADWGIAHSDLPVLIAFDDGILQRVFLRVESADVLPVLTTDG
ncbi:hypothetical protein AB0M45_32900 [Nocardia sp. NPDC051787]|uniref:hypothetical protein n=1 Tax=Nocardia sp. NPDC051787 TaxID=3155415 RepID=UPI00341CAE29